MQNNGRHRRSALRIGLRLSELIDDHAAAAEHLPRPLPQFACEEFRRQHHESGGAVCTGVCRGISPVRAASCPVRSACVTPAGMRHETAAADRAFAKNRNELAFNIDVRVGIQILGLDHPAVAGKDDRCRDRTAIARSRTTSSP